MSYWQKRISRRLALRTAAATGFGAAALSLIGCGGSNESGGAEQASGLVSKPVDTTSKAKQGGIMARMASADVNNLDPLKSNNSASAGQGTHVYSRLTRFAKAKYPNRPDGRVDPDAAASWEVSPDALTTTIKLRPNLKFDPRPPTNGRNLNSADVKYSWEAYSTVNAERDSLTNAVDPDAPIVSVETPDANTVIIKTAFPYAPLLPMLAFRRYMQIMPTESDGGFNAKSEMRGSGAWRLQEYQPAQKFIYRKNPDWYEADKNYLDGIDITIIPEYATGIAQFRAGNLWEFAVRPEEILSVKHDLPKLVMRQADTFERGTGYHIRFGGLPQSVFRDERLRQAASMLIDRDLFIETVYNTKQFSDAGLDVPSRWNSCLACGESVWLDPKGKELGEGAKFYQHNPAEAKKLIRAAGFTSAVNTEYEWAINNYGAEYVRQGEIVRGMLESEGDFKFKLVPTDYATVHVPQYHAGKGQFDGILWGSQGVRPEVDAMIFTAGKFGTTKSWVGEPDAKFDDMVVAQRKELDPKKRVELLHEIQRYAALHMKYLANPGQALGFTLDQPWLANKGTYITWDSGDQQESLEYLWYDESQRNA